MRPAVVVTVLVLLLPSAATALVPDVAAPPTPLPAVGDRPILRPLAAFDEAKPLREAFRAPEAPDVLGLLPLATSASAMEASCEPAGDAGAGWSQAQPLSWPTTCSGAITDEEDYPGDWYALTVTAPTYLVVTLTVPDGEDLSLCVVTEDWQDGDCSDFGTGWDERVEQPVDNGTWFVDILSWSGNATYVLDVAEGTPPGPQDDCGAGGDASNSRGAPTPIPYPSACAAALRGSDWRDAYSVALGPGEAFEALLVPNAFADFDICVFGPTGDVFDCSFSDGPGLPDRVLVLTDDGGNWTVVVDVWNGEGAYALDIRPVTPPPPQDDCGTGIDASFRWTNATPVTVPRACSATLGDFDRIDWYAVAQGDEDHFRAAFTPAAGTRMDLCVFAPRGLGWCVGAYDDLPHDLVGGGENGTWIVAVYAAGARGAYALDLVALDFPEQDDCASGTDAGDWWQNATALTFPVSCRALVHEADRYDWYRVPVGNDTWVRANVTFDDGEARSVCVIAGGWGVCQQDGSVQDFAPTARDAYVVVVASANTSAYSVNVDAAPPAPAQDDCGSGQDAAYWSSGIDIALGETCTGLVFPDYFDTVDSYDYHDDATFSVRARLVAEIPMTLCVRGQFSLDVVCADTVDGVAQVDGYGDTWWYGDAWRVEVRGGVAGAYEVTVVGAWREEWGAGAFLAGHGAAPPVSEDPLLTGIDGAWMWLPQEALGGERLGISAAQLGISGSVEPPPANATLRFADAEGRFLGTSHAIGPDRRDLDVPAGATQIFVTADAGVDWQVSFAYAYLDVAESEVERAPCDAFTEDFLATTEGKLVEENLRWPGDVGKHAVDYATHPSYGPSYPPAALACGATLLA